MIIKPFFGCLNTFIINDLNDLSDQISQHLTFLKFVQRSQKVLKLRGTINYFKMLKETSMENILLLKFIHTYVLVVKIPNVYR